MSPAVDLQGLTKRYGARLALDGLTLSLAAGIFVALLGPNDAGKSTLFQLLTGLCAPPSHKNCCGIPCATPLRSFKCRA